VLVVHGAKDRIVPVRGAKALHAALPGSRLHIEPTWGHCPQHDDPAGLVQVVTAAVDAWQTEESGAADLA
jgi:pimeloyl-ACP methyl ester carboxylesterase